MNRIDDLLRAVKPPVPELPEGFSEKLMQRIEQENITINSTADETVKRRFRLITGLATLVLAILLFSYNTYELRMNGSLELLFFGTSYLLDFLGYLPWDLILASLLMTAFSVWMINRSRMLKRGVVVTAIISYLLTGVGGAALASVGLNDRIEAGIAKQEKTWPWVRIFHHHRATEFIKHPNFRMGRVEATANGTARVLTPHGETVQVRLPPDSTIRKGQIIRISGNRTDAVFSARRVHVCNPRRVMRYFAGTDGNNENIPACCRKGRMMK